MKVEEEENFLRWKKSMDNLTFYKIMIIILQ